MQGRTKEHSEPDARGIYTSCRCGLDDPRWVRHRVEDETDPSTRHPEFRATHRATGEVIAVEAESRHCPGVLAYPGDPTPLGAFPVGVHNLLRDALAKPTTRPYLIFLDANMSPEAASPLSILPWQEEVMQTVATVHDCPGAAAASRPG